MKRWRTILLKGVFITLVAASMIAQWQALTFWGFFVCLCLILLVIFYERILGKKRSGD